MKSADVILLGIPATYFVSIALLAPMGVSLTVALGLSSLVASALVGHALFVDPPV